MIIAVHLSLDSILNDLRRIESHFLSSQFVMNINKN